MGTYDLNRIENLERGLTQPQAEKLEKVRQNLALSLAREYGNRLSNVMAEKLIGLVEDKFEDVVLESVTVYR